MREWASILGAGDEIEGIFKILIGCVVAAIWLIGAAMSAKKKKPGGQQEKSWEQILRELGGETSAPPQQPPVVRRPEPPPLPPASPGGAKVRKPIRRGPAKKPAKRVSSPEPAPILTSVLVQPEVIVKSAGEEDAFGKGAISSSEIGGAKGPIQMLPTARERVFGDSLTSRSLRRGWLVMEVLRPPLSMREPGG